LVGISNLKAQDSRERITVGSVFNGWLELPLNERYICPIPDSQPSDDLQPDAERKENPLLGPKSVSNISKLDQILSSRAATRPSTPGTTVPEFISGKKLHSPNAPPTPGTILPNFDISPNPLRPVHAVPRLTLTACIRFSQTKPGKWRFIGGVARIEKSAIPPSHHVRTSSRLGRHLRVSIPSAGCPPTDH